MVAADVAMIDRLTDGRFGLGPGGLLSGAGMLGNLDIDRNAMTMQAMILGIRAGAPPYRLANDSRRGGGFPRVARGATVPRSPGGRWRRAR